MKIVLRILLLFFTAERREERGEEVRVVREGGRGRGVLGVEERSTGVGRGRGRRRGRGRGISLLSTQPHPPTRPGESSLSFHIFLHMYPSHDYTTTHVLTVSVSGPVVTCPSLPLSYM